MAFLQHVILKKQGSPLVRAGYVFFLLVSVVVIKLSIKKFQALEPYAAFMILVCCMISLTEQSFYISPDEFRISPV